MWFLRIPNLPATGAKQNYGPNTKADPPAVSRTTAYISALIVTSAMTALGIFLKNVSTESYPQGNAASGQGTLVMLACIVVGLVLSIVIIASSVPGKKSSAGKPSDPGKWPRPPKSPTTRNPRDWTPRS